MEYIENLFLSFDDHNDVSLNTFFENFGYENKNSLRNLGSATFYIFLSLSTLIIIPLLGLILRIQNYE